MVTNTSAKESVHIKAALISFRGMVWAAAVTGLFALAVWWLTTIVNDGSGGGAMVTEVYQGKNSVKEVGSILCREGSTCNYYSDIGPMAIPDDENNRDKSQQVTDLTDTLFVAALNYANRGEHQIALQNYREAEKGYRETDDYFGLGAIQNNVGNMQREIKNFGDAKLSYESAIAMYLKSLEKKGVNRQLYEHEMARTYNNLGNLYRINFNDPEGGRKNYEQALSLFDREKKDGLGGDIYYNLGTIVYNAKDYLKSVEYHDLAANLYAENSEWANQADVLYYLGWSYKSLYYEAVKKDGPKARVLANRVLDSFIRATEVFNPTQKLKKASSYMQIGDIYFDLEEFLKSATNFEIAARLYDGIEGEEINTAACWENTALAYRNIDFSDYANCREISTAYSSALQIYLAQKDKKLVDEILGTAYEYAMCVNCGCQSLFDDLVLQVGLNKDEALQRIKEVVETYENEE